MSKLTVSYPDWVLKCACDKPSAWYDQSLFYREYLPWGDSSPDGGIFVEIGCDHGFSAFHMAYHHPTASVYTIDNFTYHNAEDAKRHMFKHLPNFPNLHLLIGDSGDLAKYWVHEIYLLHIDGDHSYEGVSRDFNLWSPFVKKGGCVMFHDVDAFPETVGLFFKEIKGRKERANNFGVWYP